MSMPVPATLTSYLPVLLVSVTHNAAPDDSSFDTLPEGQVDYLSHDWKEEDVWRSWRSMTRQKNAIANGMRLENASWRTWWKQRNKLKTISPETLNWLKDSDVTWLYGPLHIGHDWTVYSQRKTKLHPGHRKTSTDALPGPYATNANPVPATKKPILKRRSISQLLSLPASPFFSQADSDDEGEDFEVDGCNSAPRTRPPLVHTKSDTHITMRGRPFRKSSPPRIIAENNPSSSHPSEIVSQAPSSDASGSTISDQTSSDQDLSSTLRTGSEGPKKKHISFNTFVEQYIAIEKPNVKRSPTGLSCRSRTLDAYDDGYDSEWAYDGEYDEPSSYYFRHHVVIGSDSEDDDDDVLEMRTASSRSRSNSISSLRKASLAIALASDPNARPRPPMVRRPSADRERVTIAPIAPTLLKSTGVGNELATFAEENTVGSRSSKDSDLVYVPTANHYSLPGTPNVGHEDVYHHRESYFTIGTATPYPRSPISQSPAPGASPQVVSVAMPSEHAFDVPLVRRTNSGNFFAQPFTDSPMQLDDTPLDDAYDYFGGPDLGEDFSSHSYFTERRHPKDDVRDDDMRREEIVRYSEGGAASVTTGRNHGWQESSSAMDFPGTADADMPIVVVNEVNGAVEERQERSRDSSPHRMPEQQESPSPSLSTTAAVPVSRASAAHSQVVPSTPSIIPSSAPHQGFCLDSALLSPSDVIPTRGRMPHPPSVSGSTTTGSSSYSSSDSRSGSSSRGRPSTRTSSFSDRERSSSRSRSRGTNSPLGSISPTGSAVGIGSGSAYARGRDRGDHGRDVDPRGSKRRGGDEERGRERTGRRLGDSLSPPSVVSSPSRGSSDEGLYQPYSPVLTESLLEKTGRVPPSPPSSVSGSSTETASVSTVGPSNAQQQPSPQPQETLERPKLSIHAGCPKSCILQLPIPSPILEVDEEEQRRSRHPTPSNSPVAPLRMVLPAQKAEPVSSPVSASHERASPLWSPPKPSSTSPSTSTEIPDALSPTFSASRTKSPTSRHSSRAQRVSLDGMQEHAETLVNRAAEIVQSARGFLGSIWNSNVPGSP